MTPDSLAAIEGDLTQVSNEILPGYDLDLVVFNCTSSSSILGDDAVKLAIQESKPSAKVKALAMEYHIHSIGLSST